MRSEALHGQNLCQKEPARETGLNILNNDRICIELSFLLFLARPYDS